MLASGDDVAHPPHTNPDHGGGEAAPLEPRLFRITVLSKNDLCVSSPPLSAILVGSRQFASFSGSLHLLVRQSKRRMAETRAQTADTSAPDTELDVWRSSIESS